MQVSIYNVVDISNLAVATKKGGKRDCSQLSFTSAHASFALHNHSGASCFCRLNKKQKSQVSKEINGNCERDLFMNIAYLGWGSLVWNSRGLKVSGLWEKDGPLLPVEFARVSNNKSLTLVLYPEASDMQTLWVRTALNDLKTAIQKLATRERTSEENIGYVSIHENSSRCNTIPNLLPRIVSWAKQKELDTVIWTDLASNFKEVTNMEFNEENAVDYLQDLTEEDLNNAEKYVRNAPEQVETNVRKRLKEELGWRSLLEYQNGFWLDKNTFIKADKAQINMVERKIAESTYGKGEKAQMLILTNAVEMTVDKNGKILGVETHPKFGLWLDAVNKAMKSQDKKDSA